MSPERYPCPCDKCDEFALMDDEYCIKCQHHGCGYDKCKCPEAKNSHTYCDYCFSNVEETAPAPPYDDENRICAECIPLGEIPDEERWWEDDDDEDAFDEEVDCPNCENSDAFLFNVSCSECGFIPKEHRM